MRLSRPCRVSCRQDLDSVPCTTSGPLPGAGAEGSALAGCLRHPHQADLLRAVDRLASEKALNSALHRLRVDRLDVHLQVRTLGEMDTPNAVNANPSFWLSCTVTGSVFHRRHCLSSDCPDDVLPCPGEVFEDELAVPVAPTLRSNVAVGAVVISVTGVAEWVAMRVRVGGLRDGARTGRPTAHRR